MLVFHQELFPVDSDSQAQLVRPGPYVWGLYLLVPLVDSGSRFWDRLTEKTGSFVFFVYREQSRFRVCLNDPVFGNVPVFGCVQFRQRLLPHQEACKPGFV